jgi:biotin transport system ATP-binding protein
MLIEFKNVSVERERRLVLTDLSLTLSELRIGVVGPNGSGKSSLVRLINGLLLPKTGHVWVDGLDTAKETAAVRRKVGFVFQNPDNQIVFPVVHEDIEFGLKQREPDPKRRALRAQAALGRLGVGHLTERSVHTLSGGERQLVALAAVLATEPDMLVFDEPTTQLDLRLRNRFERHLAELLQPALVVSHDLALMRQMHRVLVIDQGRLAFDGAPAEALDWYQEHCA